ncbi:MAG: FHA domain-containing protein [Bdellovibrionales bacterium]|nr:FHA domain-containing protein [Bdellovibrionales bacterium]
MPKPLFKIKIKTPKTGTELLLTKDETTVGRSSENDVCIDSAGISRKHLKIKIADGEIALTDLGSTNGTFYKGKKLPLNLPVDYFGGPFNLGPASDGNIIEILEETAVKDGTKTFTRAKALSKPDKKDESRKIEAHLEPIGHDPSRSIVVEHHEQVIGEEESVIKEMDPNDVEALNKKLDGEDTPSVLKEPVQKPAAKGWETESENSILLSVSRQLEVKAELERLRLRQLEVEKELREAEIKKHEVEDQIRQLRQEMVEQENRLSGLRDKIKDEDARFRKKAAELEENFSREETYFKGRREELERDQKAVEKLHRETAELKSELAETKDKLEKDLENEKEYYGNEHEKLMKDHRTAKAKTEDEFRVLKEKLEATHAAREADLAGYHNERKVKLEAEHRALVESNEAEHADLMKRLNNEQTALTRKLENEAERARTETEREKKRLTDDLNDHRQTTERETVRISDEHKTTAAKLADEEKELRTAFEAQQKTHQIRLERLVAEIDLRETQEQKVIEQRRTEKVVLERELTEVKRTIEDAKKDLERLVKDVAAANEKLERRRNEESDLKKVIGVHETLELKLQTEFRKLTEQTEAKKAALTKLEAEFTEQQKKNKLDRDTAVKLAHEEKTNIILEGRKEAEAHEAKVRKEMDEFQAATRKATFDEVNALRAAAQAELESEQDEWKNDLSSRKSREQNQMNLWAADEKKKLQDRLSGDLDAFVDSVTRTALSKVGQNSSFSSLIHEFHGKFAIELKNALTSEGNEIVAPFNPDRKQDIKSFWVKSAVASIVVVLLGITAYYAPDAIREAARERRASHEDGATGEWIKKIQAEREQRLALKLDVRTDFQMDYANNVLYNEGYLEMKLDNKLQSAWVKELNNIMTGEKTMGMDEEALVDYIRIEHALFLDLADKKSKMNGLNKEEFIAQMKNQSKDAKNDLLSVLRNKTLPSSDRARTTTAEQKWNMIRALEQRFYNEQVVVNSRRPASK